ncbi:hypothetical protein LINPERPRIM_LOCUS2404 [Linum perenne]
MFQTPHTQPQWNQTQPAHFNPNMPLGDHPRTYLHQYTQLTKFSNAHKSTVHHLTSLTKSLCTRNNTQSQCIFQHK